MSNCIRCVYGFVIFRPTRLGCYILIGSSEVHHTLVFDNLFTKNEMEKTLAYFLKIKTTSFVACLVKDDTSFFGTLTWYTQ